MHRIDEDGNVDGQFTEGDPALGQQATRVGAAWLNAVQEEIANAIEGAGHTLKKEDNAQLASILIGILAKTGRIELVDGTTIIRVPGGLEINRGSDAEGPAIWARGHGAAAPAAEFVGSAPIRAVAETGASPAVFGETKSTAAGPVFSGVYADAGAPKRGIYHIGPSGRPSEPADGDVYRSTSGGLYFRHDGEWVPLILPPAETARVIVGEGAGPSLGAGWDDSALSRYPASYYFDGRRVWLDGFLGRSLGADEVIFTLPVGRRPAHKLHFHGALIAAGVGTLEIRTNGEVATEPGFDEISNLSLAGVSFEVAP